MNVKSWIVGLCLSLCSTVFAGDRHLHPQANNSDDTSSKKNISLPGYCEIEVINRSYDNVKVYGVYNDGLTMEPFNVYSFERPHYISLFYYGYCHLGMNLDIVTWSGYHKYSDYTEIGTTVQILP